ncbi:MAG: LamG domain-containing protein, partial [Kiritimatiellae bacterium]|nr:LamG domain-containing protein [Kiritimatiellia bacterium]
MQGNPSFTTDGAVGKCWQSAGTAWAEYSNDAKWSALGDGSTVSISVWAKFDGGQNSYARILSTMSNWTNKQGYELTVQQQVNEITVGSSAQSQFQYVDDKGPGGEMVYLTAVFEADKTARLYINGVCEKAQTLNQVVQPTEPMHIACVSNGGNIWNGKLDELRLHATAESPDWVKACYDTMTSEEFLYTDGSFALGGEVPLSFRVADCVQSGTQAEISGILTQLGTGASAVAVKLFYSTDSSIDENCDFIDLGTITEKGQINAIITGLTPAETYYYAFQLVNDAETPETLWTETGSFLVEASTVVSDAFSVTTENCKLSVSAEVLQWGIGATKVELLIGSTADSLEVVQTFDGLTEMPENGMINFDSLILNPGSYSCSIRVTTTYGDVVWVNETPVKSISVSDTATYTWIGNSGNWSDKSKWNTTEDGSAGY